MRAKTNADGQLTRRLVIAGRLGIGVIAAMFLTQSVWGGETEELRAAATVTEQSFELGDRREETFDPSGGLPAYLAHAAVHSPRLRAAFYRWKSALERTGYVGALPDPRLMYSYFIENVETRVGPQEQRLSVRQSFPWFGTLGAKKDAASQAAVSLYRDFQSEKLGLFYRVKAAYYRYYFLGRNLAITRDNLELLAFWESVARAKYRVALRGHPDVIKAQVELGKLEDHLLRLEDEFDPAATRLRALLDLPDTVTLPVPAQIAVTEDTLGGDSIVAQVMARNPSLSSVMAIIEKERAGTRLAGKLALPEFTVGVDYVATGAAINPSLLESGKDPWIAGVGISLPIWFGKNAARKREATARLRRAEYAYDDARNRLRDITVGTVFEYHDALRKVRLYRDGLVPKAEQSLNTAYTAYQAGQADFLNVLDAQRQLLDFQLQYERSVTELATRRAELEMLAGQSLEN